MGTRSLKDLYKSFFVVVSYVKKDKGGIDVINIAKLPWDCKVNESEEARSPHFSF